MLLPASAEFIALCRSQIALLLQGLGVQQIAIYLAEQFKSGGEVCLKPLVLYPDEQTRWPDEIQWQIPTAAAVPSDTVPFALSPSASIMPSVESVDLEASQVNVPFRGSPEVAAEADSSGSLYSDTEPLILPLMQDSSFLGILMVSRPGQGWQSWEESQLEQVAQSLSLACVLDQRSQWLTQSNYRQQTIFSEEHNRLRTLLHQFRNPLTALRTLGKLMTRRLSAQDPNHAFAQSIVQQSDRLEALLQQFSDTLEVGHETMATLYPATVSSDAPFLPASEVPTLPPSTLPASGILSGGALLIQPCWLHDILTPIVEAVTGRLDEQQQQLLTSLADSLPPVPGDPHALEEVFSNLIDNALKYTPAGGTILLELLMESCPEGQSQQQVVYLTDNGPGIPTGDLWRIFDGQYRGVQAQTGIPGSGLGLAIVRDLLEKMNAHIEAFSPATRPLEQGCKTPAGPGTTFRVCFPLEVNPLDR